MSKIAKKLDTDRCQRAKQYCPPHYVGASNNVSSNCLIWTCTEQIHVGRHSLMFKSRSMVTPTVCN